MIPPEPNEDTLRCYSKKSCGPGIMVAADTGAFCCPQCDFRVRLKVDAVPEGWYETWADPPPILSSEDPSLPFCETCNKPMIALATTKGPLYGTQSIFFQCIDNDRIVHRLETYFIKLSAEESASLKNQLKKAYGLYMIWDLVGHNFDMKKILEGPDLIPLDLTRFPEEKRQELINKLQFMKFVGILLDLEISEASVRFRFDKELLARNAACMAPTGDVTQ